MAEFGPIFDALGLSETADYAPMRTTIAARAPPTPTAADQRQRLHLAPSAPIVVLQ